jgi:enoyl-[acyl-carrier-protein] reductase (NADH)
MDAIKKASSAESVANMIKFLLSDASASITGVNHYVDSGTI